jgi:hypothetical protein
MFRIQHRQKNGVFPSNYYTPLQYLLNSLFSNTNKDHMQKICLQEVDVPTYELGVKKTIGIFYSTIILGCTVSKVIV